MVDRVERLTNLLALLLETAEPLSLVQIAAELDGQYPDTDELIAFITSTTGGSADDD